MRLFFRLLWPRSRRSLSAWTPLIAVGAISCASLSLALGVGFGYHAQQETAMLRDGSRSLPPRTAEIEGPLRSTRLEATAYGPLVVTVFAGEAGQRLGLPGIPQMEPSGTVMASPAVLAQLEDDWTGELGAWLGGQTPQYLPNEALAHPREMVIVEFVDMAPPGAESSFYPVAPGKGYFNDSSFVIMGIIVLALPSVVLARAGAAMHLDIRSRRYGLLRTLGTPPRSDGIDNCSRYGGAAAVRRAAGLGRLRRSHIVPGFVHAGGDLVLDQGPAAPRGVRGSHTAGYHSRGPGQHRSDCPPRRSRPNWRAETESPSGRLLRHLPVAGRPTGGGGRCTCGRRSCGVQLHPVGVVDNVGNAI